jgi:hypothetical protein
MWPFDKSATKTKRVLTSLVACKCGHNSFGTLQASDAVHCNHCGAMYLIGPFVMHPVAKYEMVPDISPTTAP